MEFDLNVCQINAPVVFFPVRHHSPACARLVRQLVLEIRPATILIEGPSDFNDRLFELTLPHQLPIAIYSYIRLPDGKRRGAFYPFCIYSPEWQAIQIAQELTIPVQFIDLPWAEVATENTPIHRYADAELKQSSYVANLCEKLGVEDFDTLWDTLFEIDRLSPLQYLDRCHHFCFHIRSTDAQTSETDLRREAFMAEQIRTAIKSHFGQILVVTGGFHSYALYEQICLNCSCISNILPPIDSSSIDRGLALTPYSYARLDSLTGYESGMPNPGFYHAVWQQRSTGEKSIFRLLLAQVAKDLRQREQTVSSADLIAVETMGRGLATLRGHAEVWRQDLIDGIIGALVKEELEYGCTHPFCRRFMLSFADRNGDNSPPGQLFRFSFKTFRRNCMSTI
ncbi:MAG: ChaN family lipoprotein [Leptolyngbyaceae cyanobacterium SM1_3_5]|nr:ChaN family lipoprotein [Leptolyngbyaceae cyanobacterium SM1_3_5]